MCAPPKIDINKRRTPYRHRWSAHLLAPGLNVMSCSILAENLPVRIGFKVEL